MGEVLNVFLAVFWMFLWLCLLTLPGYWAANIMEDKGRSRGAGWALGLLLSLVGVLIAAALMPDHEVLRRREGLL